MWFKLIKVSSENVFPMNLFYKNVDVKRNLPFQNSLYPSKLHKGPSIIHRYDNLRYTMVFQDCLDFNLYLGTNLPDKEKYHVCMRITFYCLIANTKKFCFWWIREEILYLSYIHHNILLLKLYCVSLLLNIYTFYRRMWKCQSSRPYQIPLLFILPTTKYFHWT